MPSDQKIGEELTAALRAADSVIGYAPLPDEQEFGSFLKERDISKNGMSVLADRTFDPSAFAESLVKRMGGKKAVIFVPGRRFDASGTRHGRGGGWYDRFLAAVPRGWLRVGVLKASQLSETPLTRESWDEPMDALLVRSDRSWDVARVETSRERR